MDDAFVLKSDSLISPWLLAAVAAWLVFTAIGTMVAIPVFANVASPGLQCDPVCPTVTTTEWLPSLLAGGIVASAVIGVLVVSIRTLRRPG